MMAQPGLEQETFKTLLEDIRNRSRYSDGLEKFRSQAWERYLSLGLPSKQHEAYRYVKLRHLFSQPHHLAAETEVDAEMIAHWIYPECKRSVIVFVNGFYEPRLSCIEALPAKVSVSSLQEAARTYGAFIQNHWTKSVKEESDPFAALNSALHQRGVFIYVPPKCIVDAQLQILHVTIANDSCQVLMPRVQIFAGAHSHLQVAAVQKRLGASGCFVNQVEEIALDEGARVHYSQMLCDEHPQGWHFDAFRASLKRDSSLTTVGANQGSMAVRTDYKMTLAGENAEALLNGVWMLEGKREAHVHVLIDHQSPHCRSYQLFKGVLGDFSRSSFEGKIMVRQAAQKTEAFQLNNNLLLSDNAHANSKPNLEIFADDVKASHGATVGQLDPEQLFYMKTRGFSEEEAKNLLVFGFCEQVIEKIPLFSMRGEISDRARQYLRKENS